MSVRSVPIRPLPRRSGWMARSAAIRIPIAIRIPTRLRQATRPRHRPLLIAPSRTEAAMPETVEKLARIRTYIKAQGLDGIVVASRANFAWLSGGGDSHVVSQSEIGFGALV